MLARLKHAQFGEINLEITNSRDYANCFLSEKNYIFTNQIIFSQAQFLPVLQLVFK